MHTNSPKKLLQGGSRKKKSIKTVAFGASIPSSMWPAHLALPLAVFLSYSRTGKIPVPGGETTEHSLF